MRTKRGQLPFWGIVVTFIVLLWALVSLGNDNGKLRADYKSAVEEANKRYDKLESEFNNLEKDNETLTKTNKELKKKIQSNNNSQTTPAYPSYTVPATEREIYNYMIKRFGPQNGRIIFAVCKSESGLNPTAANWNDAKITGYPSLGICQINGHTNWDWKNYKANIDAAYYRKFLPAGGFTPWTDYKNGNYLKFLPKL